MGTGKQILALLFCLVFYLFTLHPNTSVPSPPSTPTHSFPPFHLPFSSEKGELSSGCYLTTPSPSPHINPLGQYTHFKDCRVFVFGSRVSAKTWSISPSLDAKLMGCICDVDEQSSPLRAGHCIFFVSIL